MHEVQFTKALSNRTAMKRHDQDVLENKVRVFDLAKSLFDSFLTTATRIPLCAFKDASRFLDCVIQ